MPSARVSHPIFARVFPGLSRLLETGGMAEHRASLLAGLAGQVIDVGAGTGASFAHYPASVTSVLAIEPEPRLRAIAAAAATDSGFTIQISDGLADRLPPGDQSFDAAVVTFVLCSVPDQDAALGEIRRVLRPGGALYFLEHVRADAPGLVRAQQILDATVWPHLFGSCHLARDTEAAIERAGFRLGPVERFKFPEARTPVSFHIAGRAVTP